LECASTEQRFAGGVANNLLSAAGSLRPTYDLRRGDASQTAPGEGSQSPAIRLAPEAENIDLRDLIWFVCVGLFIVERVLSPSRDKGAARRSTCRACARAGGRVDMNAGRLAELAAAWRRHFIARDALLFAGGVAIAAGIAALWLPFDRL
jgi:hypothetical protein